MSATLIQHADLTDSADAWRFNMPVGGLMRENTDPTLISQDQATRPPTFRTADISAGFKLALARLFRTGGTFSIPHGPRQSSPRLRRVVSTPPGPIRTSRAVEYTAMAPGLVPTRPAYETWTAGDSYLSDYVG